jgi:primary-amine oxidase
VATTERPAALADHPLAPLTLEEVREAVGIVHEERDLGPRHRFAGLTLNEPPKEEVLAFEDGDAFEREAFAVILDGNDGSTYEAVISLTRGAITSWTQVPNVQPPIVLEEFDECEAACKESSEFQESLRKRGIEDMDRVLVDPWSAGSYGDEEGRRLSRALTWVYVEGDHNAYAHPVDNLVTIVDLNEMEVVRVEDHGVVPIPQESGAYEPNGRSTRAGLKPLEITQPDGPSFEIEGHEIRWQKWSFRIGFTPREGLVLYTVGYEDGGRVRPVLYRASLSEMVVPYGDPRPGQWRKNAFDAGEYNVGALANSLELGCDCLGEIRYFDAVMVNGAGDPVEIKNAVCLHEEDAGLGWKHYDMRADTAEVRRSRRLVVSFIATVANYEYGFYWNFYQDGTIEFDGKLTGIVSTGAVGPDVKPAHGQLLNKDGLYGPIHQHFMNFRLDLDVDGRENRLYEVHTEAVPPGDANPHGNAYLSRSTLLERESEPLARREHRDYEQGRRALRLPPDPAQHQRPAVLPARQCGRQQGRVRDQAFLGDQVLTGRTPRGRGLPQPEPGRRPAEVRGAGPPAGGRGRGRLVHARRTPRGTARRLARHAGAARRLQARAGRLLRPEPRARRAAPRRALPPRRLTNLDIFPSP